MSRPICYLNFSKNGGGGGVPQPLNGPVSMIIIIKKKSGFDLIGIEGAQSHWFC